MKRTIRNDSVVTSLRDIVGDPSWIIIESRRLPPRPSRMRMIDVPTMKPNPPSWIRTRITSSPKKLQ